VNADFLELETLGPLEELVPGAAIEHVERWSLHKNVEIRKWTDAELDRVLPLE
jgi:3-methyladenine DNA glycosylase AlkC